MDIRRLIFSGTLAGLGMAILTKVPILSLGNTLCCAWIWLGTALAAWHYNYLGGGEGGQERNISLPEGIAVGVFSGIVAAAVGAFIHFYLLQSVDVNELLTTIAQILGSTEEIIIESLPFETSSLEATLTIIDLIGNLFIYSVIGVFGGAFGARLFGKRPEPAALEGE